MASATAAPASSSMSSPGLWDSWADDAFIRDVDERHLFRPREAACAQPQGENLSVRGPLNIARPIQGWPVIVQAGASEAGRQIAAETAEVIFAAPARLAEGQRLLCRRERPDGRSSAAPATT